jgi:CubicO group peptidase (beta-lactamase class C family)
VRTSYVEPKVLGLSRIWQLERTPSSVTVQTWLPFLAHARSAVHRPGLGCTIVSPGTSEESLRRQPFRPAPALGPDPRPWPLGEGAPEADRLSDAARSAIERHASLLFDASEDDPVLRSNTTALLVARDGHLVYERYGPAHGRNQPQIGWSMTKTLTAIIAGTLARTGVLALDEEVGLERWNGTAKQVITWRQLLNMAPGLAWFEGYGGKSDVTDMLYSAADEGAWAADLPLTSEPGTTFTYSTGTSTIAMLRMRELLGGEHQTLYDHYQLQLFQPLGIRGGVIEPDASGTPVGGARGVLRPVDWLRLGQLVANRGTWNGETLLARDWVDFMTAPSPADAGYGGSIWRKQARWMPSELRSRLPDDVVWFAGILGQYTVVVPSRGLVVLRMGVAHDSSSARDRVRDQVFGLVADLLDDSAPR